MKFNREQLRCLGKFIGFSLIGILAFFVPVSIGGKSSIPIDHLVSLLKEGLHRFYPYLLVALSGCAVLSRLRKRDDGRGGNGLFFAQSLAGFLLSVLCALGLLPDLLRPAVLQAMNATGNIICAIFVTALFIPFLTEYGLVDFCAILCRPIMRRVFLTPGSSAVIGVSAFLGNYSVGHVISRRMYDEGYFTEKEALIVATGFSTCSMGLMINLVNYTGLMGQWHMYVLMVLAVTFGTTIVVVRLRPIRGRRNAYKDGVMPVRDEAPGGRILPGACSAGISKASQAPSLGAAMGIFLRRTLPMVCEIAGVSMFVIPIGTLLANNTRTFLYFGQIFLPLLRLVGLDAEAAVQTSQAVSVSLLEPVLAGVISEGKVAGGLAAWLISVVPYSSVIFFAGFVPSLWKSGIPCKLYEILLLWLERVAVGIVLTGVLYYLLSFAGWLF